LDGIDKAIIEDFDAINDAVNEDLASKAKFGLLQLTFFHLNQVA